ncbi:MAG: nuclear transport factor 2 family protein [Chloroflexi bacterium]|nr:nuclear transport factor 2 family protein [Chloroflexota bacterium]
MSLKGKGFFIFQIPDCEGGDPDAITAVARAAGLGHVLVKIADGANPFGVGITAPVVQALQGAGISVWGWHYVYGNDPAGEARVAVRRFNELGLDGYAVNAETEYKNKNAAARRFMSDLRAGLPDAKIALSSYRFPNYHPELPWKTFFEKCDYNMPQVYWVEAHNAGQQLRWSKAQFDAMGVDLPFVPSGAAYSDDPAKWNPTPADVKDFLQTVRDLNMEAANFFSWDYCRRHLPKLWKTVSDFDWPAPPPPPAPPAEFVTAYHDALNAHAIDDVMRLYRDNAVLVTRDRILRGTESIRTWYGQFFNEILPNGEFQFTKVSEKGDLRFIIWDAASDSGTVSDGRDTVMLSKGKVALHYSYFTVK